MQPSKQVEKYLRKVARTQPKAAPDKAKKAARAASLKPVDARNPTRVQLKRIVGKQMRRALVELEDRVIRRAFLRLQNGQRTSTQTVMELTAKQAYGVAQLNRAARTTAVTA